MDEQTRKLLIDGCTMGERESPKQCGRELSIDIFLTFLLFSCFFEYNSGEKENLSC